MNLKTVVKWSFIVTIIVILSSCSEDGMMGPEIGLENENVNQSKLYNYKLVGVAGTDVKAEDLVRIYPSVGGYSELNHSWKPLWEAGQCDGTDAGVDAKGPISKYADHIYTEKPYSNMGALPGYYGIWVEERTITISCQFDPEYLFYEDEHPNDICLDYFQMYFLTYNLAYLAHLNLQKDEWIKSYELEDYYVSGQNPEFPYDYSYSCGHIAHITYAKWMMYDRN